MTEQNKAVIRRFYEELWNARNFSLLPELMTEEARFRGSFDIDMQGTEVFQEYMEMVMEAFPDFRTSIDAMVAEGDKVSVRLTYTGTHEGEIYEVEPSGRVVTYQSAAFFTLENGKIVDGWVLGDLVGMLDQMLIEQAENEEEGWQEE